MQRIVRKCLSTGAVLWTFASPGVSIAQILQPSPQMSPTPIFCAGDCDGSGVVTIEEAVRMVAILLDVLPVDACSNGDSDGNASVTVDEIVRAVSNVIYGCGLDLPDLIVTRAERAAPEAPPPDFCHLVLFDAMVCVANRGAADAAGFFVGLDSDATWQWSAGLRAGEEICLSGTSSTFPLTTEADSNSDVDESNEANNRFDMFETQLYGGGHYIACTPTPAPSPTATMSVAPAQVAYDTLATIQNLVCSFVTTPSVRSESDGATLNCMSEIGHYGSVSIRGFTDAAAALAAFGVHDNSEVFLDHPFYNSTAVPPCCAILDGLTQSWAWLNGCWIVSGYAFDDTGFRLAPQPDAIYQIVRVSEVNGLFATCPDRSP